LTAFETWWRAKAELLPRWSQLLPPRPWVALMTLGPLALVSACSGLPNQGNSKNGDQPAVEKLGLAADLRLPAGLLPTTPPAEATPAKAPPAAGSGAIAGLTPLPSPERVVSAMGSGRLDPFSPPPGEAAASPATTTTTSTAVPLAPPANFRLTGLVLSGSQAEALVQFGDRSGSLRQGDRGGRSTDLLPAGWAVARVDLRSGVLTLSQGRRLLPLQL